MRFQNLADVHTGRHTQRIQNDLHRRSVREMRHVFFLHDLGDDALVAVTAGHLVTDGQFAFGSDVNLHRLDDAGFDAFTRLGPFDFLVVLHLQIVEASF